MSNDFMDGLVEALDVNDSDIDDLALMMAVNEHFCHDAYGDTAIGVYNDVIERGNAGLQNLGPLDQIFLMEHRDKEPHTLAEEIRDRSMEIRTELAKEIAEATIASIREKMEAVGKSLNPPEEPKEVKEARGRALLRLFGKRLKSNGRLDTPIGDKTAIGLYETVKGVIVDDPSNPRYEELF